MNYCYRLDTEFNRWVVHWFMLRGPRAGECIACSDCKTVLAPFGGEDDWYLCRACFAP